jgi:hypothetical protein
MARFASSEINILLSALTQIFNGLFTGFARHDVHPFILSASILHRCKINGDFFERLRGMPICMQCSKKIKERIDSKLDAAGLILQVLPLNHGLLLKKSFRPIETAKTGLHFFGESRSR